MLEARSKAVEPYLSVVIATYRRATALQRCLHELLDQDSEFEVIIVEDGSNDVTETLRREWDETRVFYFQLPRNVGQCPAINSGVLRARGEVIAFLDDDAVPLPGWVQHICRVMKSCQSDLILTGPVQSLKSSVSWLAETRQRQYEKRYRRYESLQFRQTLLEEFSISPPDDAPRYLCNHFPCANVAMPKRLFKRLEGFHSGFRTMANHEFSLHALTSGIPIVYDPALKVAHEYDESLRSELRKAWVAGLYRYLLNTLYPDHAPEYATSLAPFVKQLYVELRRFFAARGLPVRIRLGTLVIWTIQYFSYIFHARLRKRRWRALSTKPRGLAAGAISSYDTEVEWSGRKPAPSSKS